MTVPLLFPVLGRGGAPLLSGEGLASLWEMMEDQGIARRVFADGTVRSAEGWVELLSGGSCLAYLIVEAGTVWGCVWLNGFDARLAEFHGFLFRGAWGRAREFGPQVGRELFSMRDAAGEPLWETFMLKVPTGNAPARALARALGARHLGRLRGGWSALESRPVAWDIFIAEREDYL